MTPSISEMGRQMFLWLLNHELANDILQSLRSAQKWTGHTLSENVLINMIPMWKNCVW